MKFLFVLIGILSFTPSLLAKENVGHILFYQTLSDLPESETLRYIQSFREIVHKNRSSELTKAFAVKTSIHCARRKMNSCHPALFGENVCTSKRYFNCLKAGKRKRFRSFFADPAFHRISWNSLGLHINKICSSKKIYSCIQLFQLKEKTLTRNKKHLQQVQKATSSK